MQPSWSIFRLAAYEGYLISRGERNKLFLSSAAEQKPLVAFGTGVLEHSSGGGCKARTKTEQAAPLCVGEAVSQEVSEISGSLKDQGLGFKHEIEVEVPFEEAVGLSGKEIRCLKCKEIVKFWFSGMQLWKEVVVRGQGLNSFLGSGDMSHLGQGSGRASRVSCQAQEGLLSL